VDNVIVRELVRGALFPFAAAFYARAQHFNLREMKGSAPPGIHK